MHASPESTAVPFPLSRSLLTVRQLAQKYPDITTESALRGFIFASKIRNGHSANGFAKVMVRFGAKILLDEEKFFTWRNSQLKREALVQRQQAVHNGR